MPRTAASAGAKLNLMLIAFAFTAVPVTFGSAIVCVLAGSRLISYWWLALTFGWAVVPLAILVRAIGYQRRVHAAQPSTLRATKPAPR
jgi:hypothetical protein